MMNIFLRITSFSHTPLHLLILASFLFSVRFPVRYLLTVDIGVLLHQEIVDIGVNFAPAVKFTFCVQNIINLFGSLVCNIIIVTIKKNIIK